MLLAGLSMDIFFGWLEYLLFAFNAILPQYHGSLESVTVYLISLIECYCLVILQRWNNLKTRHSTDYSLFHTTLG